MSAGRGRCGRYYLRMDSKQNRELWRNYGPTAAVAELVKTGTRLFQEMAKFEAAHELAPDRYVLKELELIKDLRLAADRAQRLIVERAINDESGNGPSARQMADRMGAAASTLTRWAAAPLTRSDDEFDF